MEKNFDKMIEEVVAIFRLEGIVIPIYIIENVKKKNEQGKILVKKEDFNNRDARK